MDIKKFATVTYIYLILELVVYKNGGTGDGGGQKHFIQFNYYGAPVLQDPGAILYTYIKGGFLNLSSSFKILKNPHNMLQ